ncbi:High-affinity methionine permease [Erysiphe neolycopersici]|uniref:High-affinity methionine permease n=1 Tax=Erysiphe neolycopersici TaxID=212602 RepID=A0A420I4I7_9PEZI|nr:High-affinity methionine permease [Erysiphe neolycopersici]
MDPLSQTGTFLKGVLSTAVSYRRSSSIDFGGQSPLTPRRPSQNVHYSETQSNINSRGQYSEFYREDIKRNSISITTNKINIDPKSSNNSISQSYISNDFGDNDFPQDQLPSISEKIKPTSSTTSADLENKLGTFSAINVILGKTVGVGIYSVPSSVYNSAGSVGASILLWIIGSLISFCGLSVYLDLGTGMPRSGGERVYLERIYRRPFKLASCIFMAYVVLLGISTPNCIVLGEYMMYTFEITPGRWNVRCVAVVSITILCLIHAFFQKFGLRIINSLSVSTIIILIVIIISGVIGACMRVGASKFPSEQNLSTAQINFSEIFAGSSNQPYDYATALIKILYCFRGYSAANQILSDVRDPVRTLRVAAPVALGLVSVCYLLVIISYFLVISSDDFRTSGIVIAGHFFRNVFGAVVGNNVLPVFLMISAIGNIAATSYTQARVNQELGREGLLPFSDWLDKKGLWDTPKLGLFIHWFISTLVIILPPPGRIYNFLVDIGGYPVSVISVAISLGLLYLQYNPKEMWQSSFHAKALFILVFAASNLLLLVMPWIKPKSQRGDSEYVYYAYPATALAIMASGMFYWCWWASFGPGGHRKAIVESKTTKKVFSYSSSSSV